MKKPSLLVIFLTVFIDLIGFGIVLPLLPIYSSKFGASFIEIGLIIASFSVMQFLFAPAWGRLSDRIGRRPVLLVSLGGSVASYGLFAFASMMHGTPGLWLLLASRIFAGICGANLSVASAYIADVSTRENRSKGMGLIGMAFGFGFILGPAIGALSAAHIGDIGPGLVAALICAFNFVLACFRLVESRSPNSEAAPARPKFEQWSATLRRPKMGVLIATYFMAIFCFAAFESTISLFLYESEHFRYDVTHVGYLFAYCGVVAAGVQGGAIGRLVKRFGEPKLISWGLVIVAASLGLLPFVTGLAGLLLVSGLFAVGSGINRPPTLGMISLMSPVDEQGASLGVAQSAGSLARILGPVIAYLIYTVRPSYAYFFAAALALFAGLLAWRHLHGERRAVYAGEAQGVAGAVE